MFGCRTKQKTVSSVKENSTTIETIQLDSVKQFVKAEEVKKTTDQKIQKKQEDFSGDIIIKGKSDSLNPLFYHNVVGKDTLQSITIKGNAEFSINNHYKKSAEKATETKYERTSNIIQDFAKTAVSKETISDVATAVTSTTKKITSKGLSAGAWIIFAIFGIVIIICVALYIYIKK